MHYKIQKLGALAACLKAGDGDGLAVVVDPVRGVGELPPHHPPPRPHGLGTPRYTPHLNITKTF